MFQKLVRWILSLAIASQTLWVHEAHAGQLLCRLNLSGSPTETVDGMLANRLGEVGVLNSGPIKAFRSQMKSEMEEAAKSKGAPLEYEDIRKIFDRNFADLQLTLSSREKSWAVQLRGTALALVPLGIFVGLAHLKGDPHYVSAGMTSFVTVLLISIGNSVPAINNLKGHVANWFARMTIGKNPAGRTTYPEFTDRTDQRNAKYSEIEQSGLGRTNAFQQQLMRNVALIVKWLEKGDNVSAGKVLGATAVEMYEFFADFHLSDDYKVIGRVKEQMETYWLPEVKNLVKERGHSEMQLLSDLKAQALLTVRNHPRYAKDENAQQYFDVFLSLWTLTP